MEVKGMRVFITFLILLSVLGICFAQQSPDFKKSVVVDGKTFVPLREMAKWMRITVNQSQGKIFLVKNGKTSLLDVRETILVKANIPFTMVYLRSLIKPFGYRLSHHSKSIVIEGENQKMVLTPKPFIDLDFPGFRGTGKYGDFYFPISGGRKKYPVPKGWFWVYLKRKNHVSSQWPRPRGGAKMPYSLFFYRGSAIHVGSLNLPSHACVHVRWEDGKRLFREVPLYTLVRVKK